ncbi:nucleotidyltransferase family protein [Thermodesulfobacteriota bacterium]
MPVYKQYLPENRRNEIELLLCCARAVLNDEHTQFIKNIDQKKVDWDHLIQMSFDRRVMPLLYRNLIRSGSNRVPDEFMEKLRHRYLSNATENIYLTGELLKVLELLEGQNILALPFKGPVLAQYLYGDISLRQFSDLDLLIHRKDIIKTRELLLANGYQDSMNLDDRQFMAFARIYTQNVFMSHDYRVNLELHWEMSNRYISNDFDIKKLNGCLETIDFSGKKVKNLQVNELLFYLCLHGTKHHWETLEMIYCVAELIRSHPKIDWDRVICLGTHMRSERTLFLGLFLAHDLYGVDLPYKILNKIADDSMIYIIAKKVYNDLFRKDEIPAELSIKFRNFLYHMNVRNRFSEKIWFCVEKLIRPKVADWVVFPLPATLSFLHYLLRPIRLAYKWTMRIPDLIRSGPLF